VSHNGVGRREGRIGCVPMERSAWWIVVGEGWNRCCEDRFGDRQSSERRLKLTEDRSNVGCDDKWMPKGLKEGIGCVPMDGPHHVECEGWNELPEKKTDATGTSVG